MKQWEKIYSQAIQDLQNFKRPQIKLDKQDFLELHHLWEENLQFMEESAKKKEEVLSTLEKIFCILDHSQKSSSIFDDLIQQSFPKLKKPELIIYLLSVSQKHIIQKKFLEGNPIPKGFFGLLKDLLKKYQDEPEIIEWTLRTIEQLGNQSIKLREEVLTIKPRWGVLFNNHKKASRQIIEMLEKRWAPFIR
jgi:hypothetical protein